MCFLTAEVPIPCSSVLFLCCSPHQFLSRSNLLSLSCSCPELPNFSNTQSLLFSGFCQFLCCSCSWFHRLSGLQPGPWKGSAFTATRLHQWSRLSVQLLCRQSSDPLCPVIQSPCRPPDQLCPLGLSPGHRPEGPSSDFALHPKIWVYLFSIKM